MAFLSARMGKPVGSFGALAIYCLYKTFALPDGGAVISSAPLPQPRGARSTGAVPLAIRHGSWLAQRSSVLSTVHEMVAGDRGTPWGQDFNLGNPQTPASRATSALIPRLVDGHAAQQRRRNYHVLLDALGRQIRPLFDVLPEGASPVALLFRLDPEDQPSVRKKLLDRGVRLANFWLAPHPSLPKDGFDRTQRLRSSVVGLPVHQELRDVDLERIMDAVRAAIRPSS
jgi:hypothetical protein